MNRRRLLWLCGSAVLIGAIVAAWFVFANRDADFHVIGPKTKGVRLNLALLESEIDVADFHDCTTVHEAIRRLNLKFGKDEPKHVGDDVLICFGHSINLDYEAIARNGGPKNVGESHVHFSIQSRSVTVKQFLRETFRQAEAPDVHFIVRPHSIFATTLPEVQLVRTDYVDNTSIFDRLRQIWKDITGDVEEDPMELLIL